MYYLPQRPTAPTIFIAFIPPPRTNNTYLCGRAGKEPLGEQASGLDGHGSELGPAVQNIADGVHVLATRLFSVVSQYEAIPA